VLENVHSGSFKLARDGDYKVNEKQDVTRFQRFESIDQVLRAALQALVEHHSR
jgi:hypothetical protein